MSKQCYLESENSSRGYWLNGTNMGTVDNAKCSDCGEYYTKNSKGNCVSLKSDGNGYCRDGSVMASCQSSGGRGGGGGNCKFQNQTGRSPINGIYDSSGNVAPGTQAASYYDKKTKKNIPYWDFTNVNVPCDNCGNYHISTGDNTTACYKFINDNNEDCIAETSFPGSCTPIPPPPSLPQGSKSNFGKKHSGMSPLIIILITLAVIALIIMLMKKKKIFFGKRK